MGRMRMYFGLVAATRSPPPRGIRSSTFPEGNSTSGDFCGLLGSVPTIRCGPTKVKADSIVNCAGDTDLLLRAEVNDNFFPGARGRRKVASIGRKTQGRNFLMGNEVKEFEKASVTAKSGIKIKKLLLFEDDFSTGHVVKSEVQSIVQAGEIFCIGREIGLPTSTQCGDVRDTDLFLVFDVPGFHAQAGAEKYDLARIRGELGRLSVRSINSKYEFQRIAGENIDAALILCEQIFSFRAETKMFDVAAQRAIQLFASDNRAEMLRVPDAAVVQYRGLPLL